MNDCFAVTAVPEDDGSVRVSLQANSCIPGFYRKRDFCDLRRQLLEAVEAYGEQTSHLVISPFCIPDQDEDHDRDMICNALSQLPNVRALSFEESKESPDYYYGLLLLKLNQLLELFIGLIVWV